jgi:hypothetical protein
VRAPQGNSIVICPVQKNPKKLVEKVKRFMFCPSFYAVELLRVLKTDLNESRVTLGYAYILDCVYPAVNKIF